CLAAALTPTPAWDDPKVDTLVQANFFAGTAHEDANLKFVDNRICAMSAAERHRVLKLYTDLYNGYRIPADDLSPTQKQLDLLGLISKEKGTLRVRNRLYQRIFNDKWIRANMPTNIRQIIALATAIVVVLLIGLSVYGFIIRPQILTEQAGQTAVVAQGTATAVSIGAATGNALQQSAIAVVPTDSPTASSTLTTIVSPTATP